ncbi:LacI family DNA-binding transcriptional regulator [Actinoplanes sp. ATCC 53533]|uniref:LacI family DNA-binding transcriptional regulator n=1 Tax=Actinoplanes sp. ATCC 53533 TaxID=1288362 RepID=UPI001F1E9ED9|nr:LacI family DNA-binding transcriptional regulator [Actinoplanes sp. ATCC 53533]
MTKRVTIATIAQAAGVSVPTVSRVLNNHGDISRETRERVERLLREYDYRPRASRRPDRSGMIDFILPDLDCPWAMQLLRGVEHTAREEGVGVTVSAAAAVRPRRTDGAVLVTMSGRDRVGAELRRLAVPMVSIDPGDEAAADVPTIGVTNWSGGRTATEHLIGLGHRRIGMIGGPKGLLCSRARLDGHRAALEDAGLPLDPGLLEVGDFSFESGVAAGGRLLDRPGPPTAIFAANDQMALGVYAAAWSRGLRVPEDLSVVGFDDLDAHRATPPLTTVRQPLVEMGRLATRTLLGLIRGEPAVAARAELVTELIVRASIAAPGSARGHQGWREQAPA